MFILLRMLLLIIFWNFCIIISKITVTFFCNYYDSWLISYSFHLLNFVIFVLCLPFGKLKCIEKRCGFLLYWYISDIILDWLKCISGYATLQEPFRSHHIGRHRGRLYVKPAAISGSSLNPLFIITSQRIEDSHEEQIANIKPLHMCLMNNTNGGRPGVGAMLLQNRWHYAHDTHMRIESVMLLV